MKPLLFSSLCLGLALAFSNVATTTQVYDFADVLAGDDKGKKGGKDGKGGKGEEDEEDVAGPVFENSARWG